MSAIALLLLCFCTTVVSGDDSTESVVTAAPGDVALLPCYNVGNVTPTVTSWKKDEISIISGGASSPSNTSGSPSSSPGSRLEVLPDGSLSIAAVERGDGAVYLCASTLPGNNTFHARVVLQVVSGPANVSLVIDPVQKYPTVLPNGTYTIIKGSSVYFMCSAFSYPSQELTLAFTGLTNGSRSLVNNTGQPLLEYRTENIQPSAQGIYSCIAQNNVSHQETNKSAEVLVYYASDRHPECMWTQDSSFVLFHCSWFGVYPAPMLNWTEVPSGRILASEVADRLAVKINGSLLSEGQTLRCTAEHLALHKGEDRSCTFTLKTPYPHGKPLATAVEGTSITLVCSETTSTPPAVTTWRRGLKQEVIMNNSKYTVTAEGPSFQLTIVNITKEDEGVYFCHSENPLGAKELEVYLTVKSSSAYTGAVIGLFIAVLIVGSAIVIAKTVYSSRHKICLGGFR
ncbi:V-set and immunoglobulin domain-containing protein 10 isoform X1 [Boleophthalmus pectinirostris]|uniref:V-set and immunoglobulin domain-containing protein 10 isoform X1 n=1 Tax=Boleophthalmus pectinirostris TaxID=150288 RepID=UPI002431D19D|nr:V-set and immunoglobulin domain-containing protein 10 isoform X1 [Boleophthalmus pectinirostris]